MSKYLVVTGGSAGIGLATAGHFHQEGYIVINVSRRPCPLPEVINIQADFAAMNLAEQVATPLQESIPDGEADTVILVHNAAMSLSDTVQTVEAEILHKIMTVNVIAPTILNRLLLSKMKPSSAIIYIGSTLSEKAVPGSLSYITSKHALVGLMRATCQDLMGQASTRPVFVPAVRIQRCCT